MLDRMISGAGAVTDGADRSVRLLTTTSRRQIASNRPGSLAIAGLLVVLSALLVMAGLEATDAAAPVEVAPAVAANSSSLGDRTYATMRGSLHSAYVETFTDDNDNGVEDEGETGIAWYYWLVDREARSGVTVRSTRPPSAMYTFTGNGVVAGDPHYLTDDRTSIEHDLGTAGLDVDATKVIDATVPAASSGDPVDLAGSLPAIGTRVELSGSRLGSWAAACSVDTDEDGSCDLSETDRYEIVVFDPTTRHAVRAYVADIPEFTDATMTGLLRREERAVDDAVTTRGLGFDDFDLVVSDRYVLDDAAAPRRAPLAFGLAAVLFVVALIIVVGLAGGYLIYRKGDGRLPAPATTLGPGERMPLRISGVVRTPTGLEHVREAPGDLVRFVLGHPASGGTVDAPEAPSQPDLAAVPDSPEVVDPSAVMTTLIVERSGHPHGLEVGMGSVQRLSSGLAMTFREPRPAVRVVAATGPLVLSFDTDAERDRAAAELLDETGLGSDGKHIATP